MNVRSLLQKERVQSRNCTLDGCTIWELDELMEKIDSVEMSPIFKQIKCLQVTDKVEKNDKVTFGFGLTFFRTKKITICDLTREMRENFCVGVGTIAHYHSLNWLNKFTSYDQRHKFLMKL